MSTSPIIITNYGPDARIACEAASQRGVRLCFTSTPAAAAHAGIGWAAAFIVDLEAHSPPRQDVNQPPLWVLDCADRAGDALSAFRVGLKAVAVNNISPKGIKALKDIALAMQAKLYIGPIDRALPGPRLSLIRPGRVYERVDRWLESLGYGQQNS